MGVGRESRLTKNPSGPLPVCPFHTLQESLLPQAEETLLLSAIRLHCLVSDCPLYGGKCSLMPSPESSEIPFPPFILQTPAKQWLLPGLFQATETQQGT